MIQLRDLLKLAPAALVLGLVGCEEPSKPPETAPTAVSKPGETAAEAVEKAVTPAAAKPE